MLSEHVNLTKAWAGGRLGSGFFVLHLPTLGNKVSPRKPRLSVQPHMGLGTPLGSNLFSFIHETRSLSFPSACESENVLEET